MSDMTYQCSKCDYKTTIKCNFRRHTKSIHEGIKHLCNEVIIKPVNQAILEDIKNQFMRVLDINVKNVTIKQLIQEILEYMKNQFMMELDTHVINVIIMPVN